MCVCVCVCVFSKQKLSLIQARQMEYRLKGMYKCNKFYMQMQYYFLFIKQKYILVCRYVLY